MMRHPSYLSLDRHALGHDDDEVEAHVQTCERCQDYVDSVKRDPGPVPLSILREVRAPSRPRLGWVAAVALAATLALVVWAGLPVLGDRSSEEEPYTMVKSGSPSVTVFVHRAGEVRVWDGDPLQPGDSVRLRIEPAGTGHDVTISTPAPEGDVVLYEGELTPDGLLPVSWEVDAEPGPEDLLVVITDSEGLERWQTRLTFEKRGEP